MMKKLFLVLIVILPLMAMAQSKPLTPEQSKAKLEALKRLQTQYECHFCFDNDLVLAGKDNHYGLVTLDGKAVIPFEYDWISSVGNSRLFMLSKDYKVGFADYNGKIIIPVQYDDAEWEDGPEFTNGMMCLSKDGLYGVIDSAGRIVLPFQYEDLLYNNAEVPFLHLYHYDEKGSTEQLLRLNGDTVISAEEVNYLGEGVFSVKKNGLIGFYDSTGRETVKCQYDEIGIIQNNLIGVKKEGRWLLVDLKGKEHFAKALRQIPEYTYLTYSASGLIFYFFKNEMSGVIDTNGHTVIPLKKHLPYWTSHMSHNRIVMNSEDSVFVYDPQGHLLNTYDAIIFYEEAYESDFMPCYYIGQKNDLYGLLDSNWNLILPFQYKELYSLGDDLFCVTFIDNDNGIIDAQGNNIFKAACRWILNMRNGIFQVKAIDDDKPDNSITRFVDRYGNTTLSKADLVKMKQLQLQHEENERKAAAERETRKTQSVNNTAVYNPTDDDDVVFVYCEESPQFPGGDSALYMYLCMNLNYPDLARRNKIEGTVVVSFVVEKDGSVTNIRLLRDIGGGCGMAAVEVVKTMPKWEPGRQQGVAVRTQFNLPLQFKLSEKDDPTDDMTKEERCLFDFRHSDYKR